MDQEFSKLEQRLHVLIERYQAVQNENQQLKSDLETLSKEKQSLESRIEHTTHRIQSLLQNLPAA